MTLPGQTARRRSRTRCTSCSREADEAIDARRRRSSSSPTAASTRARADPGAAGHRRPAQPPRPRAEAHAGRAGAGDGRRTRGAPLRAADRLRRRGDQPVPGARHAATRCVDEGAAREAGIAYEEAVDALPEGDQEGRRQDHVQDGHLDDPELPRRADLRGDRPGARTSSTSTSRTRPRASAASASRRSRSTRCTHHKRAFPERDGGLKELLWGGQYQWRRDGEFHLFNPETVFRLQHATRTGQHRDLQAVHAAWWTTRAERLCTLRGLFEIKSDREPDPDRRSGAGRRAMFKRFATGAMSFGSISAEAHETLAIAMNRIGGKSNTGEGGEDRRRFTPDANGDLRRSAIKQVASGRFGVTSEYLVNADELQIKMAQGAKPGEGGQLPGHKVYPWIAAGALLHAGRRPDQPTAAPRHLLDRRPGAAHPRPQELEPAGAHQREAGRRGRRRHRRGGRREGEVGRGADQRPRRRHGRQPADLDQARRHPLGARAWPRRSRRWC